MKTVKTSYIFIAIAFVAALIVIIISTHQRATMAWYQSDIEDKNLTAIDVQDFNSIKVIGNIIVKITHNNDNKVMYHYDGEATDKPTMHVENGLLLIQSKNNTQEQPVMYVKIGMPVLNAVSAENRCELKISGFESDTIKIVGDSARLAIDNCKFKQTKIEASQNYIVQWSNSSLVNLEAVMKGGSILNLNGCTTDTISGNLTEGSRIWSNMNLNHVCLTIDKTSLINIQ